MYEIGLPSPLILGRFFFPKTYAEQPPASPAAQLQKVTARTFFDPTAVSKSITIPGRIGKIICGPRVGRINAGSDLLQLAKLSLDRSVDRLNSQLTYSFSFFIKTGWAGEAGGRSG